jgi:DNA-binding transcriptional LysR family regulator
VAAGEVGELILVQPLRQRLQRLAPSVRVGWTPSRAEENIDALRHGRCHFLIDIESAPVQAPDIRVLKLFDDTLATLGRRAHPFAKRKPKATGFAAAHHIVIDSLPTIEPIDRALAAQKLACTISSRVSSVLVGLLLVLNSDALTTLPASLAAILEKQFGLVRVNQPFAPIAFPLRLMWHSSYDRDECHEWVRGEFANLARELEKTA